MLGGSGMNTKEFMAKVRSLEFGIIQEGHQLVIRTICGHVIARVNRHSQQAEIVTFTFASADRRELLNIIAEYTQTPLAEREEEKRYYLRNVSPLLRGSGRGYLAKNKDTLEYYALSLKCSEEYYQTIFTEAEIAEMDITGFEKIEVSND